MTGRRPGVARTPSTTEPAGSRETGGYLLPVGRVRREFARLFREHDIAAHPAEVRRIATKFCAAGHTRLEDVEGWVLWYADPTGEQAARNVDRGAGGPDGGA